MVNAQTYSGSDRRIPLPLLIKARVAVNKFLYYRVNTWLGIIFVVIVSYICSVLATKIFQNM